jgi:hypothetical protein
MSSQSHVHSETQRCISRNISSLIFIPQSRLRRQLAQRSRLYSLDLAVGKEKVDLLKAFFSASAVLGLMALAVSPSAPAGTT